MIEIKNLSKKLDGTTVLDDISFSVKKGEILGFLGPNGAGKSTTMKIITSFWSPSEGEIIIDGKNNATNSLENRRKIGYLSEMVPLYEDMTVFEYLKFVAEIRNITKENIKSRLKEVIRDCGLESVIRRPIDDLSKGYRQRVGLAQAIIHEPDILILDEPTTGLDPNQIVEIRDLIKKIGQEKTVIFSTHILSEVSATCDRVIIINQGRIVGEGTPDELKDKLGKSSFVEIKIKASKDEALSKIKNLSGVKNVSVLESADDKLLSLGVENEENKDIREELFSLACNSKWVIFEMIQKQNTLEDVFHELTK